MSISTNARTVGENSQRSNDRDLFQGIAAAAAADWVPQTVGEFDNVENSGTEARTRG